MREALRRAGVPSTARLRSRLSEVPALRAALSLFEAVGDAWTWPTLRPVIRSPYFDAAVELRALEFLASRARPKGLERWIQGLRQLLAESTSNRGWMLERSGVTAASLTRTIPALERFAKAAETLAAPRSEAEWVQTTRDLLRGDPLGMRERVCAPVEDRWDVVRLDQRATLALDTLLREWLDLATSSREPIDAAIWHGRLRRVLESNEIALSTPQQHGVQVLEAHEAALTPFDHAFLVHANDGVFPRGTVGGLFTEAERAVLSGNGLPVATRDSRLAREERLWRGCAGSDRVTISYWTADSGGVPRLPSLFVPSHERSVELPRTRREPLADPALAVTRSELLEADVTRLISLRRRGDGRRIETPSPHALKHAALGAFADQLRTGGLDPYAESGITLDPGDSGLDDSADAGLDTLVQQATALFANERPLSERPSPWNGELRDPVVLAELADRFSEQREWSASQLEQYGRRPFDFLVQRVLGLSEIESAEDEANRLTVGSLVHEILEHFYRDLATPTRLPDWNASGLAGDTLDRFDRAFDTVCDRYERDERKWVGLPHVWAAQRGELRERLRSFLAWELSRKDVWAPHAVELEFGRRGSLGSADLSGPGRDGIARALLLQGRIDRVDRLGSNGAETLRVVDYKSGGRHSAPSPRAFEDAAALQGVLYLAAIERLGLGQPATAVYRTVREPADRGRRGPGDIEPTLELARHIPERVRAGIFEAVQARSTPLLGWQPGRDITRTAARISSGTRFDPVSPIVLPGAREATR